MASRPQISTPPVRSPRSARSSLSGHSAASSLSRTQVRPVDYVSAAIRLIVQESGGDIEVDDLQVTVQGCFGHTDPQVHKWAADLGDALTLEHNLPV
eukprot:4139469-Amphidinium_carterae.1